MENDVLSLMNVFQKLKSVNFEYLRNDHNGNFLFVRDGNYVVRFIFDSEDVLIDIKIVNLESKLQEVSHDENQ